MWGPSDFDRRHVSSVYYIYDLPFWRDQSTLMRNLLGGWQVSGATFFRTGTPFSVLRSNDIAGVGDGAFLQPVNLVGDVNAGREQGVLDRRRRRQLLVQPGGVRQPGGRAPSATRPATCIYNPGEQQWDIALFKNFSWAARVVRSSARSSSTSRTTRTGTTSRRGELQGQGWADPTSAAFGRVTKKTGSAGIQLSLRFLF